MRLMSTHMILTPVTPVDVHRLNLRTAGAQNKRRNVGRGVLRGGNPVSTDIYEKVIQAIRNVHLSVVSSVPSSSEV